MKQITPDGLATGLSIASAICAFGAFVFTPILGILIGNGLAFVVLFLTFFIILFYNTWDEGEIEYYLLYRTQKHEKTIRYLKADEALTSHYRSGTVYCGGRDLSNGKRVSRDESREISNRYFERENRIKAEYDESYIDWLRFVESRGYNGFIKRYIDRKISYYNNKQKQEIEKKERKGKNRRV